MSECRQVFDLSKTDNEFPNLEASVAEVRRLRAENAQLRGLLIEHGVPKMLSYAAF